MPKIKYSKTAAKSAKQFSLDNEILQGEISKAQRKEIQRIFHAANRRVQNIENSGVFSPAYNALKGSFDDRQNLTKFAKFSLSGLSEAEIKLEYAKAVAFLQQPTSTASGAKQYEKHLQQTFDLSKSELQTLVKGLGNNTNLTDKERRFIEYMQRYKNAEQIFTNAVNDVSAQIESEARRVVNSVNEFENKVENAVERMANEVDNVLHGKPTGLTSIGLTFDTYQP